LIRFDKGVIWVGPCESVVSVGKSEVIEWGETNKFWNVGFLLEGSGCEGIHLWISPQLFSFLPFWVLRAFESQHKFVSCAVVWPGFFFKMCWMLCVWWLLEIERVIVRMRKMVRWVAFMAGRFSVVENM